jgi:hypothetical protein
MNGPRLRLPKLILAELEGTRWRLGDGGKHFRLFVDDRVIAAIPCSVSERSKTWLRVRAAIRKFRNGLRP